MLILLHILCLCSVQLSPCVTEIGDKDIQTGGAPGTTVSSVKPQPNAVRNETPQEVVLRRTQSFEADEKYVYIFPL